MIGVTTKIQVISGLEKATDLDVDKNLVMDALQLESISGDDFEKRAVTMSFGSDGKVSAESFKAYNFLLIKTDILLAHCMQLASAGGLGLLHSKMVGTVLVFINFVALFYTKVTHKYDRQDAEVLLCIFHLGKSCHISTIAEEYKNNFHQPISQGKIIGSIKELSECRTLKYDEDLQEVSIIESVRLTREHG